MRRLVFLLLAAFAFFLGAQSAAAASCNVYDDFNDNGKLDGTYSISCLRGALSSVQGDASTYTEIVPVIQAKIYAENRENARRQQQGSSSAPDNRTNSGVTPANPSTGKSTSPGSKSGTKSGSTTGGSTTGTTSTESPGTTGAPDSTSLGDLTAAGAPPATTDKGLHAAIDNLGPKKATDVPTPVIVLGGFALLLIAFGSAGIVMRRRRGSSFDASDDAGNLSV